MTTSETLAKNEDQQIRNKISLLKSLSKLKASVIALDALNLAIPDEHNFKVNGFPICDLINGIYLQLEAVISVCEQVLIGSTPDSEANHDRSEK